jgi:hypothetical protein
MTFPKMIKLRQTFPRPVIENIEEKVKTEMNCAFQSNLNGLTIAVTAGSRGIRNIDLITKTTVEWLISKGALPFIIPAMGSHGGATPEGQKEVLASLGITEELCGAPIKSSMEVIEIGQTDDGTPVYMDRSAYEADGVMLINRIKTHTDFKSDIESGLVKMAAIGLGKHAQALHLHSHGIIGIRDIMKEVSSLVLASGKIIGGIGILENAFDETAHIEAIPAAQIFAREKELLLQSKEMMPKLPVEQIDLLIVDEIGKNFSGTGMDTNIIGRMRILGETEPASPTIKYIFARDLSEKTHGNALGIGLADITTQKLFNKIDFKVTNENVATSTFVSRAAVPIVMENDKSALETAFRAIWGVEDLLTRIVHIPNTLDVEHLWISESLIPEVSGLAHVEICGELEEMRFDESNHLL